MLSDTNLLESLCRGNNLTADETKQVFADLFAGNLEAARAGALLTALRVKGETPDEIAGAATAMIAAARPFPRPADADIGEIVGTGGDGMRSLNISTMSALAAAGCGLTIAKHGNRGVSSPSGAADVLTALGFAIDCEPEDSAALLADTGFAFCFAPVYHPAMRFAAPVRKALAIRTIFNILGPLTNPARPDYAVIGAYDPALLEPLADVLTALGMKRFMVIHGAGLDEAAVHGPTQYVRRTADGTMTAGTYTPADFGVSRQVSVDEIRGGSPEDNARAAERILGGHGTAAQTAVTAANLALLLLTSGRAATLDEALAMAHSALERGLALPVIRAHRAFARARAAKLAA